MAILILWAWPMLIDNRHVYGLPLAMNLTCFIAFSAKAEYVRSRRTFAYISVTTQTRDFKFAGPAVQRLYS